MIQQMIRIYKVSNNYGAEGTHDEPVSIIDYGTVSIVLVITTWTFYR